MKTQLIFLAFFVGLIFCASCNKSLLEGFNNNSSNCPTLLVKRGNKIMLLNNNKARIPGVNPIFFDNLNDYTEFVDWQRSQDIECPVLYFNEVEDTQGNTKYRMLNDPLDPQAGLPSYSSTNDANIGNKNTGADKKTGANSPIGSRMATEVPLYDADHDNPPYNTNLYPGFDPTNQNVGRYTPLDKAFYSHNKKSANAMDINWAGKEYSRRMIKQGAFSKDSVSKL